MKKRYFISGGRNKVFATGGLIFGISICEDVWNENGPYIAQVKSGAQLLINISASPYHKNKRNTRIEMLSLRSKRTKAFMCYVNLVGG